MVYLVLLAVLTLGTGAFAADQPAAAWAGDDAVVFYADFEAAPWAWKASQNPYQIGTQFEIVPGGQFGKAWHNSTKYGYIGFEGRNIPPQAGTIVFSVKANIFADGKQHCLMALPRTITGMAHQRDQWDSRGLALSLRKTPQNTLDLIAHLGGDSWMRSATPQVLASVDVSKLPGNAWHRAGVSWDFETRKVWLILDNEAREAAIPETIKTPHELHGLILGNCERYELSDQEPLDGLLDEVVVLKVPYPQVAAVMARKAALTAPRPPVPTRVAKATLFPNDENLGALEKVARQHLDLLVEAQRHGMWCLAIKWPSLMQFSAKFRLPEPRNSGNLSKDGNTAFGAAQLLFAYEALGDDRYLQAARNTCDMYLATQHELGYWVYSYFYEDGKYYPADTRPMMQDHNQTGPIFLLSYMAKVTGEQKYLDAAKRCCDFLLMAQNPNGSWAHHWDPEKKASVTSLGNVGGGEINDYGTSGPVQTLLQMYRLTGEEKYKTAALRGADWIVKAFIENDKVAGWAAQYDENDKPIEARHFEPASVTNYAPRWALGGLTAAYRETRDLKYLEPLKKTLAWFDANKEEGGWWWDYDIPTGRPIQMHDRKIYFMDDPEQFKAYVEATGGRTPTRGDWVNIEGVRWETTNAETNPEAAPGPVMTKESLGKYVETNAPLYVKTYIESTSQPFNKDAGLFTWESESGQATSQVRHQVVRFCDLLMRARAVRGDLPVDHPYFRRVEAGVTWNKVLDK